jgi:predicted metal-dependent phosphoesterase TrpH
VLTDGYYVLGADFHIHGAFGDGGLPPWDLRREAARRGLDVIAIANHNQVHSPQLHRRLFGGQGLPLLLVAEEVTAPTHHIIAVGVPSAVAWNQSTAATIRHIHARGGVAIAAHPQGHTATGYDEEALTLLDAAERTHPGMYRTEKIEAEFAQFFDRGRRFNPRLAAVGDSDFHFTGRIGLCRTYVLAREVSEAGVLDALRQGRSVAYDFYDRPYGDPQLVSIVEAGRRARTGQTRAWARLLNVLGVSMAWVALAALVLLGPDGYTNLTRLTLARAPERSR